MFIESVIGSAPKVKVLRVLLETKIAYSLNDIKELADISTGEVHKVVTILLKEGIVIQKKGSGKQKFYQINLDNKYAGSLNAVFTEERNERRGIPVHIWNKLETLCSRLMSKFKGIKSIILFGSLARGELRISSDIDLLIITSNDIKSETGSRALCKQINIKNKINPLFVTEKDLQEYRKKSTDFYENILKDGLMLA
jgi:predicted nucleotidyltransferase